MAGSDSDTTQAPASVQAMVTTAIPTFITFVIFIAAFIMIRKKHKRVYEPRSIVETIPKDLQSPSPPQGIIQWLTNLLYRPDTFLIQYCGTDGYFFIRFLFEFTCLAIIGILITWPILIPLNVTNSNHLSGLETISFSNVRNKYRFFGHIFISWIYFGAFIFLIYRELVYYTTFRHALQSTPLYDSLLSSRTLLLTEIPQDLMTEDNLRQSFPTATNIWYARNYKKLQEKVKERSKLANKYESAVNKVINKAVKIRAKAIKKNKPTPEPIDDINKYLKDGKKRPTHRLKFLIGKKVDTLDYGKTTIGELNSEINKLQLENQSFDQLPAVFMEFPTQIELQKAYQAIPFNKSFKGTKRIQAVAPDDVIWENLSLTANKRRIKSIIANAILTFMVMFWCIPVAVVSALTNINSLTEKVHFLKFLNNLPDKLMGLVSGLLPVIALAILMSLVPPFIKWMGRISGCLTVQQVNSYCQSWFYAFQIVNVFLMMTFGSAATTVVPRIINHPDEVLSLLQQYIPPASNFYISYLLLNALTVSPGLLFQLVTLILSKVLGRILDSTPRAKWNRWNNLGQPDFSVLYPGNLLICVIVMCYSIIAPLILIFAVFAFLFCYFAYLYTLVHVLEPNQHDARGRNYPSALFQMFTGLYLAQLVITAMFVFSKNWACVALEGVIILVTAISHVYLKWKFLPILDTVPISAIKHAAGNETAAYPMYDQGLKEIKTEGKNYWEGGNELGVNSSYQHDQVLINHLQKSDSATTGTNGDGIKSKDGKEGSPFHPEINGNDDEKHVIEKTGKEIIGAPKKGLTWFHRFIKPKLETFDLLRKIMPNAYFNYIEYNPDFIKNAYDDPAITADEPHIWIARDELGLSEIEKNKALSDGVQVSDDHTAFDENNKCIYTGPPPAYEEAIKV